MKKFLFIVFIMCISHVNAQCLIKGTTNLVGWTPYLFAAITGSTSGPDCPPCFMWSSTSNIGLSSTMGQAITVTGIAEGPFTVYLTRYLDGVYYTCSKSGTVTCNGLCYNDSEAIIKNNYFNAVMPTDYISPFRSVQYITIGA